MNIYRYITIILINAAAIIIFLASMAYAETVRGLGRPTGFVNDYTDSIPSGDIARLTSICDDLEAANTAEMAIVIINTTGGLTVESFAQDLFTEWGIGKASSDNGVLILVALDDRKWRVHTGYGVEGTLTDSLARRIMEREAVPEFRNGNYGQGLVNAAQQIKLVLEGERYQSGANFNPVVVSLPALVMAIAGVLIWLAVRVACPRCGSRVNKTSDKEVLASDYKHSGIRKREYCCTVCHYCFSRMTIIPMLVEAGSSSSGGGWFKGSSSGEWSSGDSSFGGFGGGSSGGGGASGGW